METHTKSQKNIQKSSLRNYYGMYDCKPPTQSKILFMENIIRKLGDMIGLEEMSTPVIELTETLIKKGGTNENLGFHLKNEEGVDCGSLRYDQTVPLVRYIVQNGLSHIRRLQFGDVFRKDKPSPQTGRFCGFRQADVDIVGNYPPLVTEVEIMWIISEFMCAIGHSNDYIIQFNFRQNLVDMAGEIGIKKNNEIKRICNILDNLDKVGWESVRADLAEQRFLTEEKVDKLIELIKKNYLSERLKNDVENFMKYCNNPNLKFTPSLARGLNYYTGIIFEVILPSENVKTVIAGGRYDKLVYEIKKKGKKYIPAIGVSFGISRLAMVIDPPQKKTIPNVYVISPDLDMRIKICGVLREMGLRVDAEHQQRKIIKSITHAVTNNYIFCVIYGESGDKIKVKELFNKEKDKEYTVKEFKKLDLWYALIPIKPNTGKITERVNGEELL